MTLSNGQFVLTKMMNKIKNSVIDNIKNKFSDLFPAEKKVAKYIISNWEDVVGLNVSELAKKSNASEATVVRTSKHLGYDGYYQMRLLMSKDIGKIETINDDTTELTSSQKIFSLESERINRLSQSIDFSLLLNVAKTILNSRMVYVVAVGNTTSISNDLGFRLERAGIPCSYSLLPEFFYNHIILGTSQDTLIAISRSGASRQVLRAIELASNKKMKIIVITGELNSSMVKDANYTIKIDEMKNEVSTISKPDSHLLEYAINDSILYCVRSIKKAANNNASSKEVDDIGILLSEFKQ